MSNLRAHPPILLPVLIAALGLAAAPAPADPGSRAVFTHAPTDIANAAGVIPLGNLNPGGRHVLAVNHMYIDYPFPATGGAYAYPVYAMADGEITMISRQQVEGRPDFDYQIVVRHDRSLAYYFDHVHGLSGRIMDAIAGVPWFNPGGGGGPAGTIFFGQLGAPDPLAVFAGEPLGITKSYSYSWDVGVIDLRVHRRFAGHGFRRYPDFDNLRGLLRLYGLEPPYAGNRTVNAGCFIDYLAPPLKAAWFALLVSDPKGCGSDAWDVEGKLRGAWFNPALDALTEQEASGVDPNNGALSIIPYNFAPETRVQIGVASGSPYAALDPAGLLPQLREAFTVVFDPAPGARIDPDPAAVGPRTGTVCYDLPYDGGPQYNTVLMRMLGPRRLAVRYDPAPRDAPQCAATPLAEPDASWVVYER